MKKTNEDIWSNGNQHASVIDDGKRVLRLGLDVHYRQVTVAIQEDGGRIKAAGRMKHPVFLDWIQKKLDQAGRSTAVTRPEPAATGSIADWSRSESKTWWWCPRRWVKEARSKRLISAMPGSCAIHWIVICVVMTRP